MAIGIRQNSEATTGLRHLHLQVTFFYYEQMSKAKRKSKKN